MNELKRIYYSSPKFWVFILLASIPLVTGVLDLINDIWGIFGTEFIYPITAVSFILLGLGMLFYAFRLKWMTGIIAWLVIILATIRLITLKLNTFFLEEWVSYSARFTMIEIPYTQLVVTAITLLLAGVALFLFLFLERSHFLFWVVGLIQASVLGVVVISLSDILVGARGLAIFEHIELLQVTTALVLLCFTVGVLFFAGAIYRNHAGLSFVWWSAVLVGVGCVWATIASFITFQEVEKRLAEVRAEQILSLLSNEVIDHFELYGNLLARISGEIASQELTKKDFRDLEMQYKTHLPYLDKVDLIPIENASIFSQPNKKNLENALLLAFPLFQGRIVGSPPALFLMRDTLNPDLLPTVGFIVKENGINTLMFLTPVYPKKGELQALVSKIDVHHFFTSVDPFFDRYYNQLELFCEGIPLLHAQELPASLGVVSSYPFRAFGLSFDFHFRHEGFIDLLGHHVVAWYHILFGVMFSVALATSVFFIQYARSKWKEAEIANREKTLFLANMSHQLRTPLHGIIGSCSLIDTANLSEEQQKWFKIVKNSSSLILSLLNDLIELEKIEKGEVEIKKSNASIATIIREALQLMKPKADQKKLGLHLEVDPKLPRTFIVDPLRLKQVIMNLLSNALKYTDMGEVRVRLTGELIEKRLFNIELTVRDTGIGMSARDLELIFSKYKMIDIRHEVGSGLGLAISERLMYAMGGTIKVESEMHKGSTFILIFQAEAT